MPMCELHNTLLNRYSELIHLRNNEHNITGLKTQESIHDTLITDSLTPWSEVIVPRGTLCIDLGSGAGVPGIPLAIQYPESEWLLSDSQSKKIDFCRQASAVLEIRNISFTTERLEDFARNSAYMESFDIATARGFAHEYITIEIAAPLLKRGGFLYIYSHATMRDVARETIEHARNLGLSYPQIRDNRKHPTKGLLFIKEKGTPSIYPRRYAKIKRESLKVDRVSS